MPDDPLGRIRDRGGGGADGLEDAEQKLLVGLERAGHAHEQPLGRQADLGFVAEPVPQELAVDLGVDHGQATTTADTG